MTNPNRSEIWLIDLESIPEDDDDEDPTDNTSGDVRREIRGKRPGLIISADRINKSPSNLAIIAPCTGTNRPIPGRVTIQPPEAGLNQKTDVLCDQIRCIDRSRLLTKFGVVSDQTMEDVEYYIEVFLGL